VTNDLPGLFVAGCLLGGSCGLVARRKGYNPAIYFLAGLLFWAIAFPWLLWVKPNTSRGGLPLPRFWAVTCLIALAIVASSFAASFFLGDDPRMRHASVQPLDCNCGSSHVSLLTSHKIRHMGPRVLISYAAREWKCAHSFDYNSGKIAQMSA
jgi:hypothetical protein